MVDVYYVARVMAYQIRSLLLLVLVTLNLLVLLMASLWFLLGSFLNLGMDQLRQALANYIK
jgi:hypothetical protein